MFSEAAIACPANVRTAVKKRRATFFAGRLCAQTILRRQGVHADVVMDARGAPAWPAGFTGSISHTDDRAFAVVLPSRRVRGVGVDLEAIMTEPLAQQIAEQVMTSRERETMAPLGPTLAVTFAFSAKESVYKFLAPLTGRFYEFADVEITSWAPGGDFTFSLRGHGPIDGVRTHSSVVGGHVLTAVYGSPDLAATPRENTDD